MNERLIRFDVRLRKDDYVEAFWDEEHRNRFLLKPGIEWPLSIDPLVWPSVFSSRIYRDATDRPGGNIEVDPAVDGGNYWLSLAQMRAHYAANKLPNANSISVAIHLFSEKSLKEDMIPYSSSEGIQCALSLGRTIPSESPPGSEFLGYDVADASWISGLTNCEYTSDEQQRLRPLWVARLNPFGLLKTVDDALEFRQVCDTRAPEHAPFWVYGISRLPAT